MPILGTLYVISTPIGNLEDITFRAIRTLKEVNLVLCEDTRTTKKLCDKYEIQTPLMSFHGHSHPEKVTKIIEKMLNGENIALVSDAGTPGISDPGYILTSESARNNIRIVPIPGAAAFLTALQGSGMPINQFLYLGFLPLKKGRKTLLELLKKEEKTFVFYESVHRIQKTLSELASYLGENRQVVIGRELTKLYEEFFRGTLKEAGEHFKHPKGEFVVIVPAEGRGIDLKEIE